MNRFRTKRKAKDDATALPVLLPPTVPPLQDAKPGRFGLFGIGKRPADEEEIMRDDIDLSKALPSSDDFRTSLLMTGLSARFSMLREQDDPKTKVGKASDDSVLFPRRSSRMNELLCLTPGLNDIAEVESLRPYRRKTSFGSDDAASTLDSVMNRSRPIEGNNLFGGRQKIYKIVDGKTSATSGRALYDDDVALSAFQKHRLEERKQRGEEHEGQQPIEVDESEEPSDYTSRTASPLPFDLGHRRETASTTSLASLARLSTAATSITSNPAPSLKDWTPTLATSACPSPAERSVARTRRLYEQGLHQELHDNQSSALHRIDTLSQRPISRTPDLNPAMPSAAMTLADRLGERRSHLNKLSAPNLRTALTPPTMSSPRLSPTDKASSPSSSRDQLSMITKPLTPPISDTEEHTSQPLIQDKLIGSGFGIQQPSIVQVFHDPAYVQRRLALDTVNGSTPTEPAARVVVGLVPTPSTEKGIEYRPNSDDIIPAKDIHMTSFLVLPDSPHELDAPETSSHPLRTPSLSEIHPIFRDTGLNTPALVSRAPSPTDIAPLSGPATTSTAEHDSPTLGPTTGGLSGMVRAHLRADSNASSIYGPSSQAAGTVSPDLFGTKQISDFANHSTPWESHDGHWSLENPESHRQSYVNSLDPPSSGRSRVIDYDMLSEQNEFANQLADGARRIRERLISYAEADPPMTAPLKQSNPARTNTLEILKLKTSRASLADRPRENKPMKMFGLGAATMTTSPSPRRPSPENTTPIKENDYPVEELNDQDTESMHAGLKVFRQAKMEIQWLKERETQRHHPDRSPPCMPSQGRNRRHPPIPDPRQSEESKSRLSSLRDRCGSEPSDRGSRPPRLRQPIPPFIVDGNGRKPMSLGLPGTDIRRSPHMPTQPYPGRFDRSPSPQSLFKYAHRGPEAGPVSPLGLNGPLPFAKHSVPSLASSRAPPNLASPTFQPNTWRVDDSKSCSVRKKDIDHTSVSTTSQVPPVHLDTLRSRSVSRSRSGSGSASNGGFTPPLPPINPKRRVINHMLRKNDESSASLPLHTPPTPPRPSELNATLV